ncbi:hypothetical protein niasHS_008324 [Heterodera schachtii]|uniref:lysoplasmalogenase n=1 Tax=Heterodera schachtii TaxID=97005 RepID=A0ABD2IWR8_HETSC
MQKLVIYLLSIAFFYEQTNGFNDKFRLKYTVMKTLPILCLALFVHFGWHNSNVKTLRRRFLLVAALLCAACGDFVISIRENADQNFALSALFFGIAHIFYMAFLSAHFRRLSVPLALCCASYVLLLNLRFLSPHFASHPFSTFVLFVYSLVLSTAFVVSGSLVFRGTLFQSPFQKYNLMHFVGYCVFCVSDTLLLLEHAGVNLSCHKEKMILSTYYLAQFLIVRGALEMENQAN